ncbi:flagellar basal body rod protein FlgB [Tepidanaerobacter syntrophicus]|uniref:flagellar basal body rod protein FlgB n=1 Tax=Tepidanaerobacter syntrophicus TaxID=224999 RepID=UPI0024913D6D|nr:flagellar basal body rod protein FlgB [Tepidanaerobacter syntrophicus]
MRLTGLFDNIELMGKLLDVKAKRHELISNNLANVDTPGYKRSDIAFEEILKSKLDQKILPLSITNDKHINLVSKAEEIEPQIYKQQDYAIRNDENNVDVDREMIELLKNNLSYDIISEQLQTSLKLLQTAINEGRK